MSEKEIIDYVSDWLQKRYIKEYFTNKEQRYSFTKPELIKFIQKIFQLMEKE